MSRLSASGPHRSSLWRRLRPRENAATLLRGARVAALVLAAAALALGVAENAAAQTTLVSNVVATSGVANISFTQEAAQAFTTGATGATVSSVEIISSDTQGDDFDLSLCTTTSPNDRPTSTCTELTAPSSFAAGTLVFTAPANTTLDPTTTYAVLMTPESASVTVPGLGSNDEDTGGAMGWTIADTHQFTNAANEWRTSTPGGGRSLRIAIKGTLTASANTAPTAAHNTVTTGEDMAYAFMAGDFGFVDTDTGDTLASVKIVTPPALGTLALDGTAVLADDVVTEAQIDADMLTFRPAQDAHGDAYTTFTFTVNDGTVDSASAYTMTIDVTDAPLPVCTAPSYGTRRQIWTGVVTVEEFSFLGSVTGYGFESPSIGISSLLPSAEFSIGSNTYTIVGISVGNNGHLLFSLPSIRLTATERAALRLNVCDEDLDFSVALNEMDSSIYGWEATFDWSDPVVTRTLYLSLPANNGATGEPTISGTAQAGQVLTADATPIMDTDGLTDVDFTYQWIRVDADGTSDEEDISGEIAATYTLTTADVGKKVKVKVSFTDELSGVEMRTSAAYPSSGTVTADTTAPALISVTVTSTPHKTTDTYGAREHIEFSMTFDKPVTVTGAPTFAFDLGGPSTATWYAGSGTTTLRFSHAVSGGSSGDRDTNGISWAETAIALNGGTIAGTDNGMAAVLTHAAQSNLAAHKVDGRTTPVTPATITVAVTSVPRSTAAGSTTRDTYGLGETIVITVTVSESVTVEGDPEFLFSLTNMGGAANDVPAMYDRARSSSRAIAFVYTVLAGDRDNNGIWIGNNTRTFRLDVNDRIRTTSRNIDIDRSHSEGSTQSGHKVDGSRTPGMATAPPDPTPPLLVSATTTTLTVEWTHPGDGGSPLVRDYVHYRVQGADWTNWYAGETPVTRAVITNLQADTAYQVQVHSTNAVGNSSWVQSATTFRTRANTPATGAPTITGTAQVDKTLTAVTTGIMDADGLTSPTYTYQWIRVNGAEADISGANSSTYILVDTDLGKTLKVRVTFADDEGNPETLTSAATATVAAATTPPEVVRVTVDSAGSVVVLVFDEGLDVTAGEALLNSVFSLTADGQALTIPDHSIQGVDLVVTLQRGTIKQGQTVVVSYTDPTADDDTVALQDIAGNDVASFTTGQSGVPAVTNNSTNHAATGEPAITGTAQAGQELTAVTTGIMDTDGLTGVDFTYQWVRVDADGTPNPVDITDATAETYTLTNDDVGKKVKVKVSFTDDLSGLEMRTSAAYPSSGTVTVAGTNTAPMVTDVDVTSSPASGDTYGTDEMIQYTVTFDQAVTVTGTPEFEFCLGSSSTVSCSVGSPPPARRSAALLSGSGTTMLVFSYTVVAGDVDDNGIYAGNQNETIKLDTGDTIQGTVGGLDAVLTHDAVGTPTGHKVNGEATDLDPPQLESATVDDDTLTLTYDEALDEGSVPAASAYTVAVTVGTTTTNPTVTVAVGGRTVTLTLSAAPADGATVTVSYTVPTGTGAMPVRDAAGNDAPTFSGQEVSVGAALRLMGGTGNHEGRLEIRYEGQWGTVCDDYWTDVEADVACRALGYPNGSVEGGGSRFGRAHFGPGSGSILLDDVNCVGNETSLLACDYRGKPTVSVDNNNCTHSQDVGVRCQLAARARVAQAPEVSPSGSDGWTSGETLTVTLTFSEAVTVDTTDGTPSLEVVLGTNTERQAAYASGSESQGLVFTYELVAADGTHTAVRVTAKTLRTNGGRIYATSTEHDAALGHEAASLRATVSPPPANALTARFEKMPASHKGPGSRFSFELHFSAELAHLSYRSVAGPLFTVTNGAVTDARQLTATDNSGWQVDVEPSRHADVTVTLRATTSCNAAHAVCTAANGRLLQGISATVSPSLPALSVFDAEVQEGSGARLDFEVRLSPAADVRVGVFYETADGTARAGSPDRYPDGSISYRARRDCEAGRYNDDNGDYLPASGLLLFEAGATVKTVSVAVCDDAHDEGSETMYLRLTGLALVEGIWVSSYIADGTATGTITNDDLMPAAWLARFGRTVGSHVLEAVSARVDGRPNSHLRVGGVTVGGVSPLDAAAPRTPRDRLAEHLAQGPDARRPEERTLSGRELLLGSSFHLVSQAEAGSDAAFSAWGRVSTGGFQSEVDDLTMDGDVTTGLLGFDAEWKQLLAGLVLAHSEGDGGYNPSGGERGSIESSLNGIYPYARLRLNDRVLLWGLAGAGSGDLTLVWGDEAIDTGLGMRLGAIGVRGTLPAGRGFDLAVKSDALWVRTDSDAAAGLAAATVQVSRLRLILEAGRTFALASGAVLAPTAQVGLRHDGGDAETGTGVEVGAGIRYTAGMLTLEGQVRTLLAHEAGGYEEWGASGAIRLSPDASGLGPSLALLPAWGASGSAMARLWSHPEASALVQGSTAAPAPGRLDAEFGWGLPALRGRGVLTPYARVALAQGDNQSWHLGARLALAKSLNLSLEGSSRRTGRDTVHDLTLRASLPW